MNQAVPNPIDLSWDEIKQMISETSIQMKEIERRMHETDRKLQEIELLIKENGLQMKVPDGCMHKTDWQVQETDRRMKGTDSEFEKRREEIREISTRSFSEPTDIIEALTEPSSIKLFQERGYDVSQSCCSFDTYNKSLGRRVGVDLLLLSDDIAIIVQVEIKCTCRDVNRFIEQMMHFKEVCPEYADKKILLSMAAINYECNSDEHATKLGLFVIRVTNDNTFSLDPNENEKMLIL